MPRLGLNFNVAKTFKQVLWFRQYRKVIPSYVSFFLSVFSIYLPTYLYVCVLCKHTCTQAWKYVYICLCVCMYLTLYACTLAQLHSPHLGMYAYPLRGTFPNQSLNHKTNDWWIAKVLKRFYPVLTWLSFLIQVSLYQGEAYNIHRHPCILTSCRAHY